MHPPKMPSLTIDGKREIIEMALKKLGEKAFLDWLKPYNITSLRMLNENVRRYKAKFFRAMFALAQ